MLSISDLVGLFFPERQYITPNNYLYVALREFADFFTIVQIEFALILTAFVSKIACNFASNKNALSIEDKVQNNIWSLAGRQFRPGDPK